MTADTSKEDAVRQFFAEKLLLHGERLYNIHIGRYQNRCEMARRDNNERLIDENTELILLWRGMKRKGFMRDKFSPQEMMEADDAVQDEFEEEYLELIGEGEAGWE